MSKKINVSLIAIIIIVMLFVSYDSHACNNSHVTYMIEQPNSTLEFQASMEWGGEYDYGGSCLNCGKIPDRSDGYNFDNHIEFSLSGDSEVVGYVYVNGQYTVIKFISKSHFVRSKLRYRTCQVCGTPHNVTDLITGGSSSYAYNSSSYQYISDAWDIATNKSIYANLKKTGILLFNSEDSAINYLNTGIKDNLYADISKTYDGDNVYLDNFQMIVHDSNSFDNYYIEFKYTIPDCLSDAQSILLDVSEVYQFDLTLMNVNTDNSGQNEGVDTIDILNYPTGFRLYLNDCTAVKQYLNSSYAVLNDIGKRQVLGSELFIDFNKYGLSNGVARIDKSMLYLDCQVVANGVYGRSYSGSVDFLSGANNMNSYTPDSDGNYAYNNDYTASGHYYTEVGVDGAGNTTYNYYYYSIDNSKTEISANDSHDNTYNDTTNNGGDSGGSGTTSSGGTTFNNNPSFNPVFNNNNNVTVEGDIIDNEINNIIDDNTATKEDNDSFISKFLGFFNLLENNSFLAVLGNVFGWLPSSVFTVLVSAIGIIAGIAVIKFFRK